MYRDFQLKCWVNLRILGQPCEFYLRWRQTNPCFSKPRGLPPRFKPSLAELPPRDKPSFATPSTVCAAAQPLHQRMYCSVCSAQRAGAARQSSQTPAPSELALDVKVINRFQSKRAQRYIRLQLFSSTLKRISALNAFNVYAYSERHLSSRAAPRARWLVARAVEVSLLPGFGGRPRFAAGFGYHVPSFSSRLQSAWACERTWVGVDVRVIKR